jgi:probable FeS assembly SUF system protein SufT
MAHEGSIKTTREVEVVRIPSGEKIVLPTGTGVIITQALGGSFTLLVPHQAGLFRLDADHADAIGQEKAKETEGKVTGSLEEAVWEKLKTCYDPEIPVNIVDLGLVYKLTLSDLDGGKKVDMQMTLTAPGCGMGPTLAADAKQKILSLPGIKEANVDLVWEPAWSPARISDDGKAKLGIA